MYKKDLFKEWLNGHLAHCGWYLDCPTISTLKSKCELREKFENAYLDKPTSTNSSFRSGKKSHNAKKLKNTKEQSPKPSSDK